MVDMTLEEVAGVLGCTRERVRQIEVKAMRKLRRALAKRNMFQEDFFREEVEVNASDMYIHRATIKMLQEYNDRTN